MKYRKERLFLKILLPPYKRELLNLTFWNAQEKQIIKLMYLENRSIENIIAYGLMPYEKSWLSMLHRTALSKLKEWLKYTSKIEYKLIYKNLI